MSIENPTLDTKVAPTSGAFAAAEHAYHEGGQYWVEEQILKFYRHDSELGGRIMMLASLAEADHTPPAQAIFVATALLLDALSRDETGQQLDKQFGLVPAET